MKKQFSLIIILVFILVNTKAFYLVNIKKSNLRDLVIPIQWNNFKQANPSKEFLTSSQMLSNAGLYSFKWANAYYKSSAENDYFIIQNINKEQPIRTPSSAALGLAVALRTGVSPESMGGDYQAIKHTIVKLIKGVIKNHKVNGGAWGDHWQSTLWVAQIGRAGWFMWDFLDEETQEMLCLAIVYEANRHIKPDYKIKYWNGIGGDSKAEENSWDSMPLQLAIAMMPKHPSVLKWKEICSKLLVSAYSIKENMNITQFKLDGKSPKEWLDGYNVREDGIVINHNLVHNDYMTSIAHLQMSGFLLFSLAQQKVPQTLDFNFGLIYKTLVTKKFSAPPYKAPGGTMYIKHSPEQYYPEGTDWSKYRYASFYGFDALVDVLGYDAQLPKASEWRKLRGEKILAFQSRHKDGRMYQEGEFDNYWGKEQMIFWMISDTHLLQWLDDRKMISEKGNWLEF